MDNQNVSEGPIESELDPATAAPHIRDAHEWATALGFSFVHFDFLPLQSEWLVIPSRRRLCTSESLTPNEATRAIEWMVARSHLEEA